MKIEIDYDLTDEKINNILTDAVETGAIGYWISGCYEIKRDADLNVIEFEIRVENEENEKQTKYLVNRDTIFEGIRRLFHKDFEISNRIKKQILDNDIDAEGTDCIIQTGLFNEIIYA